MAEDLHNKALISLRCSISKQENKHSSTISTLIILSTIDVSKSDIKLSSYSYFT